VTKFDHVMSVHSSFEPVSSNYRTLGFHVTDLSHHPMGTGNRLIVFQNNFIEILAVSKPEEIDPSTKAMVEGFLSNRSGISGIAMLSSSQQDDLARLEAQNAPALLPNSFQRPITLPDGSLGEADVDIVMSLNQETPLTFLFFSHQKKPEMLWQPAWQEHPNGASDIVEVISVQDESLRPFDGYFQSVLGTVPDEDSTYPLEAGGTLSTLGKGQLEDRYQWAEIKAERHAAYTAGLVVRCSHLEVVRAAISSHNIPSVEGDNGIVIKPEWLDGVFLHFVL